jgi:hypothetical protein
LIPPLGIALRQTEFRIMMDAGERRMIEQGKGGSEPSCMQAY